MSIRPIRVAWCAVFTSAAWVNGAPYFQEVLADNPTAYWRLGESSGTTAVNAVNSPAGNATYSGAPALGVAGALPGDSNTAVHFQGSAAATSAATGNALFSGRSVMSVELWIRPRSNQGGIHYLEYGSDGLSDFSLESTSLNPTFYVDNVSMGSVALTQGEYAHLVLELTGTAGLIYKNGAVVASTAFASPIATNTGAFFLASRTANQRFVDADIDEVAVYNTALSPDRVLAHFNAASTLVPEPGAGLAAAVVAVGAVFSRRRTVRVVV
jgi:hypothetical protein